MNANEALCRFTLKPTNLLGVKDLLRSFLASKASLDDTGTLK
jgi:hypothetical protein